MSTEDESKKLSEDDPQATPAWQARAQRLRKNGFMKMALPNLRNEPTTTALLPRTR